MATRIEEARARLATARLAVEAVALSEDERTEAELHEQERAAVEEAAAAATTRRALDLRTREAAAEAAAGGAYLVQGIDLVALFPLGKAPPLDRMPTGGVIIIRSPTSACADTLAREVEAKKRPLHALVLDMLAASTIDPKPNTEGHVLLQGWGAAYPEAASAAGGVVRKLGGAKLAEDKRGRG